jgi:hypothetical protein
MAFASTRPILCHRTHNHPEAAATARAKFAASVAATIARARSCGVQSMYDSSGGALRSSLFCTSHFACGVSLTKPPLLTEGGHFDPFRPFCQYWQPILYKSVFRGPPTLV